MSTPIIDPEFLERWRAAAAELDALIREFGTRFSTAMADFRKATDLRNAELAAKMPKFTLPDDHQERTCWGCGNPTRQLDRCETCDRVHDDR